MNKKYEDERRSARSKVMLTAILEGEHSRGEVRVDDLSEHGARVFGEVTFPVDTPVTFRCKALAVEGFVAWVEAPFAGIGFGDPIEPKEALRTVKPAQPTAPKDFRRPGFRTRRLTAAERRRVEEWAGSKSSSLGE
jgi:hypothetical protein